MNNNIEIKDWFLKKNFSNSEATQITSSKKKIIRETDKAVLVKAGKKELWVPKSCLVTEEEISLRRKSKIEEIKRCKDIAELLRHVNILEDDMKVIADFGAIFEIQRKNKINEYFIANDWETKLYDEDGIFFDTILSGQDIFDAFESLLQEGATLSDLKILSIEVKEGQIC